MLQQLFQIHVLSKLYWTWESISETERQATYYNLG